MYFHVLCIEITKVQLIPMFNFMGAFMGIARLPNMSTFFTAWIIVFQYVYIHIIGY
jgi:hypothetical protein